MDNTISLGIGCGLGAAFFQSLSYVCIRRFNKRHDDNIVALLAWPNSMPATGVYLPALLGVAGFYLCGQFFLSVAIVHSEPSRVSPMLGLKERDLSGTALRPGPVAGGHTNDSGGIDALVFRQANPGAVYPAGTGGMCVLLFV
jgi:hypothetical protein